MSNLSNTLEYNVDTLKFQWTNLKTSYGIHTCVIHTCLRVVHVIQLAWAECQEKFGSSLPTWLTLLMQFHHQLLANSFTAHCCNLEWLILLYRKCLTLLPHPIHSSYFKGLSFTLIVRTISEDVCWIVFLKWLNNFRKLMYGEQKFF